MTPGWYGNRISPGHRMLTITHTLTANDVDLIRQDMTARMRADIIIKPGLQARAKARWPFRLALWPLSIASLVIGIGTFRTDQMFAIFSLGIGSLIFIVFPLQYLFASGLAAIIRRRLRRSVGVGGTWEINEEGIIAANRRHYSWTQFQSYDVVNAGIVLLDKKQFPALYIPRAAIIDPLVKAQLLQLLQKKFTPPVISPPPQSTSPKP
jgi:hypothetical protein